MAVPLPLGQSIHRESDNRPTLGPALPSCSSQKFAEVRVFQASTRRILPRNAALPARTSPVAAFCTPQQHGPTDLPYRSRIRTWPEGRYCASRECGNHHRKTKERGVPPVCFGVRPAADHPSSYECRRAIRAQLLSVITCIRMGATCVPPVFARALSSIHSGQAEGPHP
jgi:hypothetical protein